MRTQMNWGSALLAAVAIAGHPAYGDGPATQPATQPAAVTAEQLRAVLPATFASIPRQSADAIPDSGMSTPSVTAHYKLGQSTTQFCDVTITDYGGSDFALTMVDTSAGIGKNYADAVETFRTTTLAGYPAVTCTPRSGVGGYVNVVVAKRFIIAFHATLTMSEADVKAAAEHYDFKPLAALAK